MSKNKRRKKKPSEGGQARSVADAPRSMMTLAMINHTHGHAIPDGPRRAKDARRERQAFEEKGYGEKDE